jgi:hypothetical protein
MPEEESSGEKSYRQQARVGRMGDRQSIELAGRRACQAAEVGRQWHCNCSHEECSGKNRLRCEGLSSVDFWSGMVLNLGGIFLF